MKRREMLAGLATLAAAPTAPAPAAPAAPRKKRAIWYDQERKIWIAGKWQGDGHVDIGRSGLKARPGVIPVIVHTRGDVTGPITFTISADEPAPGWELG